MSRSTALESEMYGNPEAVFAAKQARERRAAEQAQKHVNRPTLTLKPRKADGWSEARKRAEELFDFPAAASR